MSGPAEPLHPRSSVPADQADLRRIVRSWGPAVHAYAVRVAAPESVARVVEDALRQVLRESRRSGGDGQRSIETFVLRETRRAAAARAARPTSHIGGRIRRALAFSGVACESFPRVHVDALNGELSNADRAAMEHHVARCAACRQVRRRFDQAEDAFLRPEPLWEERLEPLVAARPDAVPVPPASEERIPQLPESPRAGKAPPAGERSGHPGSSLGDEGTGGPWLPEGQEAVPRALRPRSPSSWLPVETQTRAHSSAEAARDSAPTSAAAWLPEPGVETSGHHDKPPSDEDAVEGPAADPARIGESEWLPRVDAANITAVSPPEDRGSGDSEWLVDGP